MKVGESQVTVRRVDPAVRFPYVGDMMALYRRRTSRNRQMQKQKKLPTLSIIFSRAVKGGEQGQVAMQKKMEYGHALTER